jgi:hypothetical protein
MHTHTYYFILLIKNQVIWLKMDLNCHYFIHLNNNGVLKKIHSNICK